jgi:hypothetical protein
MKKSYLSIPLFFVVVVFMTSTGDGKNGVDLGEYQWKHRLLLLFTQSLHGPGYLELKEDLFKQRGEVSDRDLLIFHIPESGEAKLGDSPLSEGSGDYLREKFSIDTGTFTVLLIGKDGGVKLRRTGRVELEDFFP